MIVKISSIKVQVDFLFSATVALLALVDTQGVLWMSFLSVMVHELGHIAAMLIMRVRLRNVRLSCCGVLIDGGCNESFFKSVAIAMSGPLANIAIFLFLSDSQLGSIMLMTGLFNLIPVIGTDGGDLLRLACNDALEAGRARAVYSVISALSAVIMSVFGVMLFISFYNPTLLAASIYFIVMTIASII